MNNQFATQRLLTEMDAYDSLGSMLSELGASEDTIETLVNAVKVGLITPSKAVEITKQTVGVQETSSVGGGLTGGPTAANWDPQGPTGTGEQMATTKAFGKKKKYQEGTYEDDEIAVFDGGEDGLTKIYKRADGSYYGINDEFDFVAKDQLEMLKKLSQFGYKHLSGELEEDAPRLAGNPSKTSKQGAKNISAYTSVGFQKAPSAKEAGKTMKSIDVEELWEANKYSQFKREAAVRTKPQQMHEAVKMINKKLDEVNKLLEFTSQMKLELSEGEETLEYTRNTHKVFEKVHKRVVEVFSKVKKLK